MNVEGKVVALASSLCVETVLGGGRRLVGSTHRDLLRLSVELALLCCNMKDRTIATRIDSSF